VPAPAAHMFIFYYAVLSEVSPPTALSPFAAAAITGGDPFRTMMLTWKYTLPAFLVPFAFTLTPQGSALLLQAPALPVLWTALTAALGIAAFAGAFGGWILGSATVLERIVLGTSGGLLFFADPRLDMLGLAFMAVVLFLHWFRHTRTRGNQPSR